MSLHACSSCSSCSTMTVGPCRYPSSRPAFAYSVCFATILCYGTADPRLRCRFAPQWTWNLFAQWNSTNVSGDYNHCGLIEVLLSKSASQRFTLHKALGTWAIDMSKPRCTQSHRMSIDGAIRYGNMIVTYRPYRLRIVLVCRHGLK